MIPRAYSESTLDDTGVSDHATDLMSDDISEPAGASPPDIVCEILITYLEIKGILALDTWRETFIMSCLDVS